MKPSSYEDCSQHILGTTNNGVVFYVAFAQMGSISSISTKPYWFFWWDPDQCGATAFGLVDLNK